MLKGDWYFICWLGIKFVVDLVSITYIVWRLTHGK